MNWVLKPFFITEQFAISFDYWVLDGCSKCWIGQDMRLSHTHIQNIKESIVEQMME